MPALNEEPLYEILLKTLDRIEGQMSSIGASVGDLRVQVASMNVVQLENRLESLGKQVAADSQSTDEKMASIREQMAALKVWGSLAAVGASAIVAALVGLLFKR